MLAAAAPRACPQPPTSYSAAARGDEDCLALDVFAPAAAPARPPRAVYVHVHGGAYLFDTRPLTTESVRYLLEHGTYLYTREGTVDARARLRFRFS